MRPKPELLSSLLRTIQTLQFAMTGAYLVIGGVMVWLVLSGTLAGMKLAGTLPEQAVWAMAFVAFLTLPLSAFFWQRLNHAVLSTQTQDVAPEERQKALASKILPQMMIILQLAEMPGLAALAILMLGAPLTLVACLYWAGLLVKIGMLVLSPAKVRSAMGANY